jgi:hypothetical protein
LARSTSRLPPSRSRARACRSARVRRSSPGALSEPRRLESAVDQAAYRILQEALTNASRHGTGGARIALAFGEVALELAISNAAPGPSLATLTSSPAAAWRATSVSSDASPGGRVHGSVRGAVTFRVRRPFATGGRVFGEDDLVSADDPVVREVLNERPELLTVTSRRRDARRSRHFSPRCGRDRGRREVVHFLVRRSS